jgi:ribonuclease HII
MKKGTSTGAPVAAAPTVGDGPEFPHGTLDRSHEQELWDKGFVSVAGCDEAGRGPLAGPVVAAACIVPPHVTIAGVHDSKLLNEEQREHLYEQLTSHPDIVWASHAVDNHRIDVINILQAAMEAMSKSLGKLSTPADYALIDGNRIPHPLPAHLQGENDADALEALVEKRKAAAAAKVRKGIVPPVDGSNGKDPNLTPLALPTHAQSHPAAHWVIKGDSKCYAIAAASIIAKVQRDRMMRAYDEQYPQYGLKGHKGYPVGAHVAAIRQHGPCDIHRFTFRPLKGCYLKKDIKVRAIASKKK